MMENMPAPLFQRFIKIILLAVFLLPVGIVLSIMGLVSDNTLYGVLITSCLVAILIAWAFFFKFTVKKKGYDIIDGMCTTINRTIFSLKKNKPINGYIIKTSTGYVQIPAVKLTTQIPENSMVRIYLPKNSIYFEKDGIRQYSSFWALELISPGPEDEN